MVLNLPKKGKKTKRVVHATPRQLKAIKLMGENGGNVSGAMRDAGYPPTTYKNPDKLTNSKAFKILAEELLPDTDLLGKHRRLLNAHRLDHMVFPLGPKTTAEKKKGKQTKAEKQIAKMEDKQRTELTDADIIQMLLDLNCSVRKIVHGEQARHVYFWSPDNKAQQAALTLGYQIRGKIKEANVIMPVQINVNDDRNKYA